MLLELQDETATLSDDFESWVFLVERLRTKYKDWVESNTEALRSDLSKILEQSLKVIFQDCKYLTEDLNELKEIVGITESNRKEHDN